MATDYVELPEKSGVRTNSPLVMIEFVLSVRELLLPLIVRTSARGGSRKVEDDSVRTSIGLADNFRLRFIE